MKLSQVFTAPNQLTLLRMVFVPFVVIDLVDGHYGRALILFVVAGFSDGLDGLLARRLHQQTLLGQYLDPIADKLLLSTLFLVLSILHKIPWKYTVLVFSRDISILAASAVLFAIAGLRAGETKVFADACREQMGVLPGECDRPPDVLLAVFPEVPPAERHRSLLGVEEATLLGHDRCSGEGDDSCLPFRACRLTCAD